MSTMAVPQISDRITPTQIDKAEFRVVRGWGGRYGYDEQEVDAFLDSCAATITRLMRELGHETDTRCPALYALDGETGHRCTRATGHTGYHVTMWDEPDETHRLMSWEDPR